MSKKVRLVRILYEGHPESKDRSAIKKNKQNKNKNLMYHYYRP